MNRGGEIEGGKREKKKRKEDVPNRASSSSSVDEERGGGRSSCRFVRFSLLLPLPLFYQAQQSGYGGKGGLLY